MKKTPFSSRTPKAPVRPEAPPPRVPVDGVVRHVAFYFPSALGTARETTEIALDENPRDRLPDGAFAYHTWLTWTFEVEAPGSEGRPVKTSATTSPYERGPVVVVRGQVVPVDQVHSALPPDLAAKAAQLVKTVGVPSGKFLFIPGVRDDDFLIRFFDNAVYEPINDA